MMSPVFFLIFCNVIWSLNPWVGKVLLAHYSFQQVAWIRYTGALITLLPFGIRSLMTQPRIPSVKASLQDKMMIFSIGITTFGLGPLLQASGLSQSRATDNALLVALEPLATIILAVLFLRERMTGLQRLSLAMAIVGLLLLSAPDADGPGLFKGNVLILASMFCEGLYSVFGRSLMSRLEPLKVFMGSLFVGWIGLSLFLMADPQSVPVLSVSGAVWGAILWIGPIGTAMTYYFWLRILKTVSASSSALYLFIQPVLGSIVGVLLLSERLSGLQWVGAGIILFSWVAHFKKPVLD